MISLESVPYQWAMSKEADLVLSDSSGTVLMPNVVYVTYPTNGSVLIFVLDVIIKTIMDKTRQLF